MATITPDMLIGARNCTRCGACCVDPFRDPGALTIGPRKLPACKHLALDEDGLYRCMIYDERPKGTCNLKMFVSDEEAERWCDGIYKQNFGGVRPRGGSHG